MRATAFVSLLLLAAGSASAGVIETIAGTGESSLGASRGPALELNIGQPFGVEIAERGGTTSLYVTEVENHRVFRIDLSSGEARVIAGTGEQGFGGDGGLAAEALLNEPYEVRIAANGDIFIVEMVGARVRRIDATMGTISTVAGTGEQGYGGDGGPATTAQLNRPHSIALDGRGGLYVADIGNHRIRRVDLASGLIETIAGTGEKAPPVDTSVATGRPMLGPRALHIVGDKLWIALREGHSVWRMDLTTRVLTHVAGSGDQGHRDGAAKQATFNGPKGIVSSDDGSRVWVVDTENQCIREIDVAAETVSTVAGSGPESIGFGGDGGPAAGAKMGRPHGITVDSDGALYIGDTNNHRVRRVLPGG